LAAGDLGTGAGLRAALEGAGRLLVISPLGPRLAEMEAAIVDAAARAGVRHAVKLSTLGVAEQGGGPQQRQYALHRASERRLERSGMAWTHLRPGPFMQNLLAQAPGVAAGG